MQTSAPAAPNPYTVNLADNLKRLGLEVAQIAALQTKMESAQRQFIVLAAPAAHGFVEAVQRQQVVAPEPPVAALDAGFACVRACIGARESRHAQRMAAAFDVRREETEVDLLPFEQARSALLAGEHARALHETAALRERAVVGNEIAVREHVAIEKDDVIAARGGDAAVARPAHARALVGLPQMPERYRKVLRSRQQQFARVRARTVVADDDFIGQHSLSGERAQYQLQRLRPIVGNRDNA